MASENWKQKNIVHMYVVKNSFARYKIWKIVMRQENSHEQTSLYKFASFINYTAGEAYKKQFFSER